MNELKILIAEAIDGKASLWKSEANTEAMRGAADRGKIGTLLWGSDQLNALADVVRDIPTGEFRFAEVDEIDPLVDEPV